MKSNKNENQQMLERRAALQITINKNKVDIDRSCFSKTEDQKQELKDAKKLHKKFLSLNN